MTLSGGGSSLSNARNLRNIWQLTKVIKALQQIRYPQAELPQLKYPMTLGTAIVQNGSMATQIVVLLDVVAYGLYQQE
jgi:hypothetical protein